MYHYVRPNDHDQPNLHYLHVDDFQRQLDYFEAEFGVMSADEWSAALENPASLPEKIILTFDDGLRDHFDYVRPVLTERGHWGVFYVSSGPLFEGAFLNVHRTHYLLGRFAGSVVLKALESLLEDHHLITGFYDNLKREPYTHQSTEAHAKEVKKLINYAIKPDYKDELLSSLFVNLSVKEDDIVQRYYMTANQVTALDAAGFSVGAHGKSHNLLTKFQCTELQGEVSGSIRAINKLLEHPSKTFCFPYGGQDSWNEKTLAHLCEEGIEYCFCVEPTRITGKDIRERALWLPRFDCNEFPHGMSYISK